MLLVALTFFAFASARHQLIYQREENHPRIDTAWQSIEILLDKLPSNALAVAERPLVNLLLPTMSSKGSLWASTISNRIDEAAGLNRLALHARIFGWSEEKFVRFMLPGEMQESDLAQLIDLDGEGLEDSGLGYWLVYKRQHPPEGDELVRFTDSVRGAYRNINLIKDMEKYGIQRILSQHRVSVDLPVVAQRETPYGMLYELRLGRKND
jgi:hypothetical protein